MTKLDRLVHRVHLLDTRDESRSSRFETDAHTAWILAHLTSDEQFNLVSGLIDTATEQQRDQNHSIISRGEERAAKESVQAWEEYRTKCVRADQIRGGQRIMTESEHDELLDLNAWLNQHACYDLSTGKLARYPA